jgi:hypothetical protein
MELAAAAVEHRRVRTADEKRTAQATGRAVTGNYFELLGGTTVVGRPISRADDTPGAPPVIVLAYPFWKSVLGADRTIVGRPSARGRGSRQCRWRLRRPWQPHDVGPARH